MSALTPEQERGGICLAHKLIPPAFWPGSEGNSLLLTCVAEPNHPGPHVCGDMSWPRGSEDDIEHLRRKP